MPNLVSKFIIKGDANSRTTHVIGCPTFINNYSLAASTAKTVTVPSGAVIAIINSDANIWARYDGVDAEVPSGDTTDGTGSELNPAAREVSEIATFSIIASVATKVSIAFFRG